MKYITAVFVTILLYSCTSTTQYPMKNHLAQSTSPYLQQHVNNPVDWYPWGPEALERAKQEDKPILVSIGYSSCHWCHVMAHESFEDDSVADLMNRYFINIKVDREERPDVDQVYMDAIHAMGLQGGWPLNVFLTPDQKPFYGGTYFPKEGWKKLLVSVANAFEQNRAKIEESSDLFARALSTSISEQYELTEPMPVTVDALLSGYNVLRPSFDPIWGGLQKAPKFPMPSIWNYLNNLYHATQNPEAKDHFLFTLDKIYQGGIYDHVGGGFSRYSVDAEWHVPHFEKMLYDNGQLLSVYAAGYKLSGMESYQHVLLQTIDWLKREMLDKEGGFYAALDADSEGVEGKFYTWSYDEILELTGKDADLIVACYDVSEKGNWEGTNVLRLQPDWEKVAAELGYDPRQAEEALQRFQESALRKRGLRVRPGRDDKKIAGWNGLALTGLLDAYQALQDSSILTLAKETYAFIGEKMISDGVLRHVDGQTIEGFADDYAAVIQSFITYYQTTFDEGALQAARNLTGRMLSHFYDPGEQLFYYSSADAESLIARKKEFFDNVIPSSNSLMAENLVRLGMLLDSADYRDRAVGMVSQVSKMLESDPQYLSQWGISATYLALPIPEIAIIGENAWQTAAKFQQASLPVKILMATASSSTLPLLREKKALENQTTIYVCFNKTCKLPVFTVEDALLQIKEATALRRNTK